MNVPDNNIGLFACFYSVLGSLEFYENHKKEFSGIEINLNSGLYLDRQIGGNWWYYYFEPINSYITHNKFTPSQEQTIDLTLQARSDPNKNKLTQLIQKYIQLIPTVAKKIKAFTEEHFKNNFIIGIHYRGTDKIAEVPSISYDKVIETIQNILPSKEKTLL